MPSKEFFLRRLASNGFQQKAGKKTFMAHGERAFKTMRPLISPAIYILIKRCLCKCGEPESWDATKVHSCLLTCDLLLAPYATIEPFKHEVAAITWKYFIFICSTFSKFSMSEKRRTKSFYISTNSCKFLAKFEYHFGLCKCARCKMKYEMFIKTLFCWLFGLSFKSF